MKASNTSVFARRLLTALAAALMALEASAVDLISNLIRCATNMTPYVVLNGVERTSGKFYGYKNASTGPGDNAFRDAKAWADEHNTPLVVVYDSGGGNSNTFTADLNDDEDYQGGRYLLQWMNGKAGPDNYNCMFTYFKGPTTAPKACKEAYEFCVKYGASSFPCVVCYWKWPDGTIKTSATSGLSSVGSFEGPVNTFITKNKPPPTPPYVPPKSNAAFAVKDGELKATVGTAQVYVPVIRTNGTDKAEKEYLVAGYPDGTAKTNDLAWAVGGAYIESSVNLDGKLSKVGDKVALYLLNTNKIAVATNSITCVAKPANSTTYPSGIGAGDLSWGEWTIDYAAATSKVFNANAYLQPDTNELGSVAFETPLDWSTSNRYDTVYTDDITVFASDRVAFEREFSYSVSNVNTVVVTTNLQLFAKLGEFEDLDHVAVAEIVVTNTTTTKYVSDMIDRETTTNTQAVVASVEATNTVYRVVAGEGDELATNKWSETAFVVSREALATNIVQYALSGGGHESGDVVVETNLALVAVSATGTNLYYSGVADATRPFERVFQSGDFVTNCVYAVAPGDGGTVTNDYRGLEGTWLPASAEFRAYATENVTYLLTEAADSEIPAPTSEDSGDVVSEMTFRVPDAATYYFVESNDFTAARLDFSFAASNSVSYVFNGGTATNVDEGAYVVVAAALSASTTNFVSVRLADGSHPAGTVTEYGDFESRQFSMSYTNAYFSVETNRYQYGISGSSEEPSKAFTLVVHGGIVWDDSLIALNDAVLSSKEFADWCDENQIATVYLDVPEPGTGASLFSYNVASNGNSGAEYMSLHGLNKVQGAALIARAAADAEGLGLADMRDARSCQIALVRADGSIGGFLRPQFNADGSCDLNENLDRLDELIENAADKAESANDAPSPSVATLAFDGEATGVLTVNDTIDCFRLAGDEWAGRKVVFAISGNGRESSYPNVTVLRYDAKSGAVEEIEGELSVFATNGVRDAEIVYAFAPADIAAGRIFVAACAYDIAAEDKFGGNTAFGYSVTARDATPNAGIITFDEQPETAVIQEATNQVYDVPLYRLFGSDGDLSVNVVVDEALTTATGRFEFTETSLVWTNGETGVKYARLVLKGSEYNDGLYDITLRIEEIDALAGVEKYFTTYTISYGKEPTDEGQLAVVSVSPAAREDGRIYVRHVGDGTLHADDVISVQVNRTGGKGPAAAYISWKNGKYAERATLSWGNYLTGTQTAFLEYGFPEPAKSGYADVTVAVTSSNSVPMVKEGSTFKVRVLSHDAPPFADAEVTWSGVQYTTTETNLTALVLPAGMNVKSLAKLSGDVPAGLKVAIVDGRLEVTGTPTAGTVSSTAVYWVTLVRDDGSLLRSMPVTVSFENKALADVNPGFTKTRTWTGLPLMEETKLTGLLDLTVAKNGKTSARYRMVGGKTVAFSAPGLAGVDADGTVTLGAKKTVKSGGVENEYEFCATLGADGSLEASVTCDGQNVVAASLPAGAEAWSADNTAERFGGNCVAAFPLADLGNAHENTLCFGSPTVRLKFDSRSAWNRGVVTFAGTLPNGKAVSGTATLVPTTNNAASASLPLFASSSSDTFSAMLELDGAGVAETQGVVPFWAHDEGGIESLSYENDYSVVGSLWSWAEWKWAGERVNVNKTSGVAAGTMRLKLDDSSERLSTVSWKGVAVPGLTPAIYGAYWYNKSLPAGDGKKRTVRVGNPVELK